MHVHLITCIFKFQVPFSHFLNWFYETKPFLSIFQDIKDLLNPSKTNLKIHENAQVRQFQSRSNWHKNTLRALSITEEANAKHIGLKNRFFKKLLWNNKQQELRRDWVWGNQVFALPITVGRTEISLLSRSVSVCLFMQLKTRALTRTRLCVVLLKYMYLVRTVSFPYRNKKNLYIIVSFAWFSHI